MTFDAEAAERISILFVFPTVPYPATDGGKIRVLNLVSRLCRIHEVTLLTFITSPADEQGAGYLRQLGVEVVGVRAPDDGRWHRASGFLRTLSQVLFHGKPFTVGKYYSVEMLEALAELLVSRKFDIVHFEMLHVGQFLPDLGKKTQKSVIHNISPYATVLGEQNIDSSVWHRLVKAEPNPLRKLIFFSQYRRFADYESRICYLFNMCLCVSMQDQAKLASLCPGIKIEVIPNGVDLDYFQQDATEEDEISLVFTGSMDWYPNEDAVLYFCDHIFPLIKAQLPTVKFHIVGSKPTERVLKLQKMQGIFVTGSVEDIRPYIANAAVYVVPLRIGGGTRLKILQALAMRKAVVSTSVGCEGLDLQPDKHLLISDEPQRFAAGAVRLMKDSSMRRRLGDNGRKLVQERYDWNVIVRKLDLAYMRSISNML